MNNAMHSYKQTQFNTIGRADLTLMLYDGAIRFLEQAQEKMLAKDMQAKGNLISKVLDIIHELDSSLNIEKGGEVAKNLHQLYTLSIKNLLMANLKVDVSIAKSVQENLERLRSGFAEAMQTPEARQMLEHMGPSPTTVTGNVNNLQLGGSIGERADQIKQVKAKAEALELAKNRFASATTQEARLQAKNEIDALLKEAKPAIAPPLASASLTHKASLAFAKADAQLRPVSQVETPTQVGITPKISNIGTPMQTQPVNAAKRVAVYANTQAGASQNQNTTPPVPASTPAPIEQNIQPTQTAQTPTQTAQTPTQTAQTQTAQTPTQTAQTPTQTLSGTQSLTKAPVNNPTSAPQVTNQTPQENAQEKIQADNSQKPNESIAQPQNTNAMINRKMTLYKNINNA